MPTGAFAEMPQNGKFFIHFWTNHGGLNPASWRPALPSHWDPSEEEVMYGGDPMLGLDHRIHHKRLDQMLTNGQLSDVFDSRFNPLLAKMNIVDGLGLMFGGSHHQGGFLGNFHGNNNRDFRTGVDASLQFVPPIPTLDQILAQSSNFYPAADPRTMPVVNFAGAGMTSSFKLNNGTIQPVAQQWPINDMFYYLFGGPTSVQSAPGRLTILDRIHEDYHRLVSPAGAGAKLSREDAQVVQQHMDSINQVERRINNMVQGASCNTIGISSTRYGPTDPHSNQDAFHQATRQLFAEQWSIYVDMMVTAINCGLCRVFTVPLGNPTDYSGDYHQNVAHLWNTPTAQGYIEDAHHFVAQYFIHPLLERLNDVATTDGRRLLDNGLVVWQHECWYATHEGKLLPTMMAGSAGGYFRTGYYIDYQNLSNRGLQSEAVIRSTGLIDPMHPYALLYPGVPMNQWLHTVFESMGISRTEYVQLSGIPSNVTMYGYGDHTVQQGYAQNSFNNTIGSTTQQVTHIGYPDRVITGANNPLPFLKA